MAIKPKRQPQAGDKATNPLPGVPLNKETIKELVIKYRGNLTKVAMAMRCSRKSIQAIARTDEEIREIIDEARERCIDEVEDSFINRAIKGNSTNAIFFLKTRGRDRGYDQDFRADIEAVTRSALEFALNKSKNPAETEE